MDPSTTFVLIISQTDCLMPILLTAFILLIGSRENRALDETNVEPSERKITVVNRFAAAGYSCVTRDVHYNEAARTTVCLYI